MRYRIRFSKEGELTYIGHLDLMRFFQKAMRRAALPMTYSQGFNPHPIMSFAQPLGLGLTSSGEYVDIELDEKLSSVEILQRLNRQMCEGISIISAKLLDDNETGAMASLAAAKYTLTLAPSFDVNVQKLSEFLAQEQIIVHKKTKRGEADVNIKPLIYGASCEGNKLKLFICTGSMNNLRPEMVLDAYYSFAGVELDTDAAFVRGDVLIHREEIYTQKDGAFIALCEIGEIVE